MWRILELMALATILLLLITEFFYPLITGKPLFSSFRNTKPIEPKPKQSSSLNDKINIAKEKVKEVKSIQNEVDKNYKSAEDLKNKADDLLN